MHYHCSCSALSNHFLDNIVTSLQIKSLLFYGAPMCFVRIDAGVWNQRRWSWNYRCDINNLWHFKQSARFVEAIDVWIRDDFTRSFSLYELSIRKSDTKGAEKEQIPYTCIDSIVNPVSHPFNWLRHKISSYCELDLVLKRKNPISGYYYMKHKQKIK